MTDCTSAGLEVQEIKYEDKAKSSSLAYNRRETRDKQPLGRDLDESWGHLHTSVKLYQSQPMAPWTLATAYECAAAQFMEGHRILTQVSDILYFNINKLLGGMGKGEL